jgi:hypothetical protein
MLLGKQTSHGEDKDPDRREQKRGQDNGNTERKRE